MDISIDIKKYLQKKKNIESNFSFLFIIDNTILQIVSVNFNIKIF